MSKYQSRHTGAEIDNAVDSVATKGDGLYYDQANSLLYLTNKGQAIGEGVYIASGGGGAVLYPRVVNLLDTLTFDVAVGFPAVVKYSYDITDGSQSTVEYIVNGAVKAANTITVGEYEYDVSDYLVAGINNVTVKVTSSFGTSMSIVYTVNAINLSIVSPFDDGATYTGDVVFRYTPYGALEKTMHIVFDGVDDAEVLTVSGRQQSKTFSNLSHGAHTIDAYLTATVNGEDIESNRLHYEFVYYTETGSDTIIASSFSKTKSRKGETVNIPYMIYNPQQAETSVILSVNDEVKQILTVDRTKQTWSIRLNELGACKLTISTGAVSRDFNITVEEVGINVSPVTENLELYLSAENKSNLASDRDVWTYGDIAATFTGFNWASDGWQLDSAGINCLRIANDARVTIPLKIFEKDFRTTGKTIEFEYRVKDVIDDDTEVINCYSEGRGFKLTPSMAVLQSEQTTVTTKFKDDEHVRLSFVVDDKTSNMLVYTYLNGILSGLKQYPADDDFSQTTPVDIVIGSNSCTVELYSIRVYNSNLTMYNILDNYIADTYDVDVKIGLYNRNNVYDDYGAIVYSKLIEQVPCMTIIGDLPASKGDKKTVRVVYENKQDTSRNFDYSDVTLDIQGTSSQYYPKKNYKIKLTQPYKLREDSPEETVFTCKADYMESSHAHNTGFTNMVNGMYNVKVPPQVENSNIRTTIDGFPIAMFYKTSDGAVAEYFGVYNFNNDKESPNVFGFTAGCESWEFCNNTSPRCLFQSKDFSNSTDVLTDFEARYPEKYKDFSKLQRVVSWVYDCQNDVEKFKSEISQYFNLEYLLSYYVCAELFGMADSLAKNMFLNTYDGQIWYPVFYDCDTMMGLNNEGENLFSYNIELHDQIGTKYVYNGQESVLWNLVEQAYQTEIQQLYQDYRNDKKLSYDTAMKSFYTNQIAKICEAQYNSDAEYKYVSPLVNENIGTYLYVAQGSRIDHIKYWLDNRFGYIDSKYIAGDYLANYATLRLYTPETWQDVEPNPTIHVTPYKDQYVNVKFGSYTVGEKGVPGEVSDIVPPAMEFNDTETIVYGADRILSLGDLSPLYAGTVDVSKATKLSELIVGAGGNYSNTNLNTLSVGNNNLLRKVDVRNCPNLTQVIDLSGCQNIKEVYTEGTSTTGVTLPNGGVLEKLHLPETVANITIKNQNNISDFSVAGYANVSTVVLENTNVDAASIINSSTNLTRVRIVNLSAFTADAALLDRIYNLRGVDEIGENTEHGVIIGKVQLTGQWDEAVLAGYQAKFPDVVFELDPTYYAKLVITSNIPTAVIKMNGVIASEKWFAKGTTVNYQVEAYGYATKFGVLTLNTNREVAVELTDPAAWYRLTINTGIEGVVVKIDGIVQNAVLVDSTIEHTWEVADDNYMPQSGTITLTEDTVVDVELIPLPDVVKVVTTDNTIGYLTNTGDFYLSGRNNYGQQGANSSAESVLTFTKRASGVKDFALSNSTSGYITESGDFYMCGWGTYGQQGNNSTSNVKGFVKRASGVKEIVLTEGTSGYLTESGDFYLCGHGSDYSQGSNNNVDIKTFTKRASGVKKIGLAWGVSGKTSGYLTESGDFYMCGDNGQYQQGNSNNTTDIKAFTKIDSGVKDFALSESTSGYITESGDFYLCGRGVEGQQGSGDAVAVKAFTKRASGVKNISLTNLASGYLTEDGDFYLCGENAHGTQGSGGVDNVTTFTKRAGGVKEIDIDYKVSGYLTEDGDFYLCGINLQGQQGSGDTENVLTFTKRASGVKKIAPGYRSSAYITEDGSCYMCGWGAYGQQGNGSTSNVLTFTKINVPIE